MALTAVQSKAWAKLHQRVLDGDAGHGALKKRTLRTLEELVSVIDVAPALYIMKSRRHCVLEWRGPQANIRLTVPARGNKPGALAILAKAGWFHDLGYLVKRIDLAQRRAT